jgi:hypothetical protein
MIHQSESWPRLATYVHESVAVTANRAPVYDTHPLVSAIEEEIGDYIRETSRSRLRLDILSAGERPLFRRSVRTQTTRITTSRTARCGEG